MYMHFEQMISYRKADFVILAINQLISFWLSIQCKILGGLDFQSC